MFKGDALLIPPATGHKLFNIGDEDVLITWSCAPHP
jgi:oxalate decarboxylase/phosphoglucose isomerase-like protein (cupin superfamily)